MSKPDELLEAAAKLFRERNLSYGSSYERVGDLLHGMVPEKALRCHTPRQAARVGVFVQCLHKLMRYATSLNSGGHTDSARDLSVYAAMLQELTDDHRPAAKRSKSIERPGALGNVREFDIDGRRRRKIGRRRRKNRARNGQG